MTGVEIAPVDPSRPTTAVASRRSSTCRRADAARGDDRSCWRSASSPTPTSSPTCAGDRAHAVGRHRGGRRSCASTRSARVGGGRCGHRSARPHRCGGGRPAGGGFDASRAMAADRPRRAVAPSSRRASAARCRTAPPLQRRTRFWSGYDAFARTALPVLDTARRDARARWSTWLSLTGPRGSARAACAATSTCSSSRRAMHCLCAVRGRLSAGVALPGARRDAASSPSCSTTTPAFAAGCACIAVPPMRLHFTLAPASAGAAACPTRAHAPNRRRRDDRASNPAHVAGGWRRACSESAIYRSIVRTPSVDSPRGRAQRAFGNVFLHVYPGARAARAAALPFHLAARLHRLGAVRDPVRSPACT